MRNQSDILASPRLPRHPASVEHPPCQGCRPITRRTLLRRLTRLDVSVVYRDDGQLHAKSPSGPIAPVRPGRWSAEEVVQLLAHLDLSRADFDQTR